MNATPTSRWARAAAALHHPGTRRSLAAAVLLGLVAATTQWLLWLERESGVADRFIGPPRSDYELGAFTLTAFDDDGLKRFSLSAPRLTRHPTLGSFDIDAPRIALAGDARGPWAIEAARAWVSADAGQLRLDEGVRAERTTAPGTTDLRLRTETLSADLNANTLASVAEVVIEQPGSILRGRGLAADLDTDVYVLEHDVSARYDPALP